MEVNKEQFDGFLAAIEKGEVKASLDQNGWIVLNRGCNTSNNWEKCAQGCAQFKTTRRPNINTPKIINYHCWASGRSVELCTIFLKDELEKKENEGG